MEKFLFLIFSAIFLVPSLNSQHRFDPLHQSIISHLNGDNASKIGFSPITRSLAENKISVQPSWIRHFHNDQIGDDDFSNLLLVDHEGNIFVGGHAGLKNYGALIAIKYAPNGSQIWSKKLGHGSFTDIDVDVANNLYITCLKFSEATQTDDYFTIKYNSDGEFLWETNFNEPSDRYEYFNDLTLDLSGNVWVTGSSRPIENSRPSVCTTIKSDSDGKILWKAQIVDSAAFFCGGREILVGSSGHGYVIGSRVREGVFYEETFLARYNSSGQLEWQSFFHSQRGLFKRNRRPAELDWQSYFSGQANGDVVITKSTIDEAENIYLTGYALNSKKMNYDYLTIKYDSTGKQLWFATYDGIGQDTDQAVDLKVDIHGNVYVTGISFENSRLIDGDITTVKYDASGKQLWVAHYDRSMNQCNVKSLELDNQQNVYVAGSSENSTWDFTLLKYNSNGIQQWVQEYDGPGRGRDITRKMVVDATGNLIITGASSGDNTRYDITTLSYDSQGDLKWIGRYNTLAPSFNWASSLLVDHSGNVYVTGPSVKDQYYSLATVKYDLSGNQLWRAYHTNLNTTYVWEKTQMTVDANNNIYVAGTFTFSGTSANYVIYKYDPDGSQQWEYIFDSQGSGLDVANDIAIDFDGYIYATGISNDQFATIKISPAGKLEWVTTFPDSAGYQAVGLDVDVDVMGNVYVLGNSSGKMTLVKYNHQGKRDWHVQKWQRTMAVKLQLDADGQILVAGTNNDYNYPNNFILGKYNSQGENIWSVGYPNSFIPALKMQAMTTDFAGKIYVTGLTGSEYTTLKYNQSGILEWVVSNADSLNSQFIPVAIGVDNVGNVYVTGNYEGSNRICDIVTIKYDPDGHELWRYRFNDTGKSWDRVLALAIDKAGHVYSTGFSESGSQRQFTTIKFAAEETAVNDLPQVEANFKLAQNYPNPFNHHTMIPLTLTKSSLIQLNIYNVSGQFIKSLYQGAKAAGSYSFLWDATDNSNQMVTSGIYYYRLKSAEGLSNSRKMILLR